jgi:adenine deaminase
MYLIIRQGSVAKDLPQLIDVVTDKNAIKEMGGGLVIVENEKVIASLALPIAGLISDEPAEKVYNELLKLKKGLKFIEASKDFNPFLTLSFLALPVIPDLKLQTGAYLMLKNSRISQCNIKMIF